MLQNTELGSSGRHSPAEAGAPRTGRGPPKQQLNDTQGWRLTALRFLHPQTESHSNDPSAGSPTETLLRLLLPLNDQVWITFRPWVGVATLPGPVRKPH